MNKVPWPYQEIYNWKNPTTKQSRSRILYDNLDTKTNSNPNFSIFKPSNLMNLFAFSLVLIRIISVKCFTHMYPVWVCNTNYYWSDTSKHLFICWMCPSFPPHFHSNVDCHISIIVCSDQICDVPASLKYIERAWYHICSLNLYLYICIWI